MNPQEITERLLAEYRKQVGSYKAIVETFGKKVEILERQNSLLSQCISTLTDE